MKIYDIGKEQKEEVQRRIADTLKERGGIIFAYLHGSFFEGNFQDVDVAVYLSERKSKREVLRCELKLERELEEVIGLPIDVRIKGRFSSQSSLCRQRKILFDRCH